MIVRKPEWPVDELVTWELREYRAKLESAVAALPDQSPDRTLYSGRLNEVISEQEARAATTGVPAGVRDET
jgi:hypothetical protein